MNPVTFLLAAAILVALGAGWVSWMLFALAFIVGLVGRALVTAAKVAAEDAQHNKLS